jgi:hypothetical protein
MTMTRSTTRQAGIIGGSLALLIMLAACGGTGASSPVAGTASQTPASTTASAAPATPVAVADPLHSIEDRAETPLVKPRKLAAMESSFEISTVQGKRKAVDQGQSQGDPVLGAAAAGKVWMRLDFIAGASGTMGQRATADLTAVTLKGSDGTELPAKYTRTITNGPESWRSWAMYEVPADQANFTVDATYTTTTKAGATEIFSLGAQPLAFKSKA